MPRKLLPRKVMFRQLLVSFLAIWYDVSFKEIGARIGISRPSVSKLLGRPRTRDLDLATLERLLAVIGCPPAAIRVVTACLEALEALQRDSDLTPEERAEIEEGALTAARMARETLTEAVRLSRTPAPNYPTTGSEVSLCRQRAEGLWQRLKGLSEEVRSAVVRVAAEFQSWALCVRVCEESIAEASRQVERSASLARLAWEIAEQVPDDPEGWRLRLQGYALAHVANATRVSGELNAADVTLVEAKRLWDEGTDPLSLLDPGRLLDLEASLRRAQRRFGEALDLLDEAHVMGRSPARVLVNKGFTLEVMGDYQRAIETLLRAKPLVDRQGDPRLLYMLQYNLSVNYTHLRLYAEATELLQQVRETAVYLGDEVFLIRVTWLDGRIASGLGLHEEALRLLAMARREFDSRSMSYDVALALLEEAALLLEVGRTTEVKKLAGELTKVFESKGVHREALAALHLFRDAAEREAATAELARRVLAYLFRARHDQGLSFEAL